MSRIRDCDPVLHQFSAKVRRSKRRPWLLVWASTCILLSSCCTPGVRPEDANLFQASCGIVSGDFDRQLENDRKQATKSRRTFETEASRSRTLQTDLEAKKAERRRLLIELDDMEEDNRQLEAQIRKMRVDSSNVEEDRIRRLDELKRIQDKLEILRLKASVEQDAFDQYHAEVSRLKQEIDVLKGLYSAQ